MPDALTPLTEALYGYLAEIEEYRALCAENQSRAFVHMGEEVNHVVRWYALTDRAAACVRASLERLPGWEASPYWAAENACWQELASRQRSATGGSPRRIALRGVAWKGKALLIDAAACPREQVLTVAALLLPVRHPVFPELPLRAVALSLACLEFLLPAAVASPVPTGASRDPATFTIKKFLERAMPKNLFASQCISDLGAGHSAPDPPGARS
jgi:hypothetical protein